MLLGPYERIPSAVPVLRKHDYAFSSCMGRLHCDRNARLNKERIMNQPAHD